MGRPKKLSDPAVLNKAFDVISREGFDSFTFAQVGRAVGLSPAALVKRFGSKERLAASARNQRWDENMSRMHVETLDSLRGLEGISEFLHLIALSVDSKRLGEHARWLGTEATQLKSKRKVAAYFETTRKIFARLLAEAVANKELSGIEPKRFAKTLEALVQGSIFQYAFLEERNIEAHIKAHVRLLLEPYTAAAQTF